MLLQLDVHGEDVLRGWAHSATTQDLNLVEEVLTAFSHGDGRMFRQWKTYRVIDEEPNDFVVEPRPRLLLRIRPFLPENDGLFSLVSIIEG
jgi:hypothetical protein